MIGIAIIGSLILSGVVMVSLSVYSLRFRPSKLVLPYAILMLAASYWAFNYAIELSTINLSLKIFIQEIRHIVIPFIAIIELWLVLVFIRREQWLKKEVIVLLLIVPVITAILAMTSQYQNLFRYNYSLDLAGPVPVLLFQDGVWYQFYILFSYIVLISSGILLIIGQDESNKFYRIQKWLVLFSLIFPIVGSIFFELGFSSVYGFNPTSSLFWISGIIWAVAFFRYGFLDLIPVGRRSVIDGLDMPMIILDSRERLADLNPAAEKLFDISSLEVIGKHIETIALGWTDLIAFVKNPNLKTKDLHFETQEGEKIFEATHSYLNSKTGEIEGQIILLSDKSYQKKLERELKENEEKYRLLFDSAPIGIGITTKSGKILEANREAEIITGYNRNELTSLDLLDMYVHPGQRVELYHVIDEKKLVFDFEIWLKRSDGSIYPALINLAQMEIGNNEVYFVTLRDISGQVKAKKEKDAILSGLKEIIVAYIDLDLNIIWANKALKEAFGEINTIRDMTDLSKKPDTDYFPGYTVVQTLESQEYREGEVTTPDGRSWLMRSNPIKVDELIVGVVHVAINITERKQTEEALQQANRKLNLLSGITRHDINNQLTVLQGYLGVLEKKQTDPAFTEYFLKINTAARRVATMIQFTREYEKIGINAPVWQDCRVLVDNAAKEAHAAEIIINNDITAGTKVLADPLITNVFYNLIDNALRYGQKITVIRFYLEETDGCYKIICEDDGDGIPVNEKEKIFERGFGKNTGLGLFLSREILEITGIGICETGEPGSGARFEMTIPKRDFRFCDK